MFHHRNDRQEYRKCLDSLFQTWPIDTNPLFAISPDQNVTVRSNVYLGTVHVLINDNGEFSNPSEYLRSGAIHSGKSLRGAFPFGKIVIIGSGWNSYTYKIRCEIAYHNTKNQVVRVQNFSQETSSSAVKFSRNTFNAFSILNSAVTGYVCMYAHKTAIPIKI